MNPLTGIWPACGNALGYRYASPDGDGFPVTYSVTHSHTDHPSLITLHSSHTFSAKERDSETGLSYFGARYYSSDLSIWLSVDPMASKYPSLSPYVYCANNPVKLVDPNGEDIVGTDGKAVSYSYDDKGNVVWSKNASDDTKRIGNAMLQTETGKEQFDKMLSSKTKITLNIKDKYENKDVMGVAAYETPDDYDGSTPLTSATINIFEGNIKDYLESGDFDASNLGIGTYWASTDKKNGVNNYIAAVVGHEAEHILSPENRKQYIEYKKNKSLDNLIATERVPNIIKTKILWESYIKL